MLSSLFRRLKKRPKQELPDGDHPYRGVRLVPMPDNDDLLAYNLRLRALARKAESIEAAIKGYISAIEAEADLGELYYHVQDFRLGDKEYRTEVKTALESKGFRVVMHKENSGFHIYW